MDLGFVFGASGANSNEVFQAEVAFADSLLASYSISPTQARIGAMTYGKDARISFPFSQYQSQSAVRNALRALKAPARGSDVVPALRLARTSLFSQDTKSRGSKVQRTLVIFTDQAFTGDPSLLRSEADALKEAGVRIVVVAVGSDLNQNVVKEIASQGSVFFPPNLDGLDYLSFPVYESTLKGKNSSSLSSNTTISNVCARCEYFYHY